MQDTVRAVLEQHGTTYAEQAGIRLRDKPAPLFQLLVLVTLASTRISADIAAAAAVEVFRSGWRTPQRLCESTWQQRVDALGRGGYRRYDESTATSLEQTCRTLLEDLGGDLRRLRPGGSGTGVGGVEELRARLQELPRLGPVGADIFCREVQAVWPEVRPFFDRQALDGARALDLPDRPEQLAELVGGDQVARFAAALMRAGKDARRRHA